jgi:hypothetical protein
MTATPAVDVRYNSDSIVTADVTTDHGTTFFVCFTRSQHWSCNCGDVACLHVLATRQVVGR